MRKSHFFRLLLGTISIFLLFSSTINSQQDSWSLIIPVGQFEEAPWSDYTSAKFPVGIGLEKSWNNNFKLRGVGWFRTGRINVGPSNGLMKGYSYKLSGLYTVINNRKLNLNMGLGLNHRRIKVEDGVNTFHGSIIPNSIWKRNSVFSAVEYLIELEILILENLSIFANSAVQVGYFIQDDTRYDNIQGFGLNLPFLDLVGLKFKIN